MGGGGSAALRKYHEKNSVLPDRIVVYRDGVGDGQVLLCFVFHVLSNLIIRQS